MIIRSLALTLLLNVPAHAALVAPRAAAPAFNGPAFAWNRTPAQMLSAHQAATLRLDQALASITQVPLAQANFANTVLAYERATAAWAQEWVPLRFQSEVS